MTDARFGKSEIIDEKKYLKISERGSRSMRRAAKKNYATFRRLIGKKVKLWAVVKSNAYGHGLYAFSKVMDRTGVDGFCVDSVVEGLALRKAGIKKHILVLGPTLPARYAEAAKKKITISISTFEGLQALAKAKSGSRFPYQDRHRHAPARILHRGNPEGHRNFKLNQRLEIKLKGVYHAFRLREGHQLSRIYRNAIR